MVFRSVQNKQLLALNGIKKIFQICIVMIFVKYVDYGIVILTWSAPNLVVTFIICWSVHCGYQYALNIFRRWD